MSNTFGRTGYATLATLAAFAALVGTARAGTETVTVTAPNGNTLRGVSPWLGQSLAGSYRMADGRRLVLKTSGATLTADLDNVPLTRLKMADAGLLQSADGSMQIRFDADPAGDKSDITVLLRTDGATAMALASTKSPQR